MILSLQPQKADSFRFAPPSRKTGVLKAFWGYVRSSERSVSERSRGLCQLIVKPWSLEAEPHPEAEPQLRSDISVCSFVLTFHRKLWSRYTRCPALATESLSTAAPQFVRKNELVAVTAGYASSENLLGLLAGSAMRTRLRRWRRWTRRAIQCPSSLHGLRRD